MTLTEAVIGGYGVFSLVGGLIGYFKARSVVSLIAGTVAGSALLWCAASRSASPQAAGWASLVIALVLGGRFFGAWRRTRRVMPDLLMVLFGGATVIAALAVLLG